jgi:hypothetical protein
VIHATSSRAIEQRRSFLRRETHYWSCATLNTVETAFQNSSSSATDVCGYCGDEFVNPADWNHRLDHVLQDHRFGECYKTKKYYHADQFHLHMLESHAGTIGNWMDVLEAICRQDGPPPQSASTADGSYDNDTSAGLSAFERRIRRLP